MAGPLVTLARAALTRRAAAAAVTRPRNRRRLGWLLALVLMIVLLPAMVVGVFLDGAQPTCGVTTARDESSWDGPGSLGGVAGTGVTSAELARARAHPLGGSRITAGLYRSTAYAPAAGGTNCAENGDCSTTASGIRVDGGQRRAYLIASNPRLLNYGARVYVWPNPYGWRGEWVVADTGGDFQGAGRLDFYISEPNSLSRALTWGNQRMVRVSSRPIVAGGPPPETTRADVADANTSRPARQQDPATTFARPTTGPLTSPFGMRWGRLHAGLDFGAPTGTPIVSVLDGTVVSMGFVGGYGNLVCVRHHGAMSTCYAHMSRFGAVRQGMPVRRGHVLGYVGSTGNSTGPHLHFEVRINGAAVDPAPYLRGAVEVPAAELDGDDVNAEQCPAPDGHQHGNGQATGNTTVAPGFYAWPAGETGGQARGAVIGWPGQGTHSWQAAPQNWQSDNAVDIGLPVGTPLYAVADGVISPRLGFGVSSSDPSSRFGGIRLHLVDSRGVTWYYAHLSRVAVSRGDRVRRGQLIGWSGTANGVGHLHLAADAGGYPSPRILQLLGINKDAR